MRRLPFIIAAVLFLVINVNRQITADFHVWNDAVCAIFFVGYVLCAAIVISIKEDKLKGD